MSALAPGSTIGILGGGQLGRMLAMAAARLGLRCHIFSDHRGPAFDVAAETTLGDFDDLAAIRRFAGAVDAVTYEFENVPVAAALAASEIVAVRPGAKALEVAQDRLAEKSFIAGLGIPVAPFAGVDTAADLQAAMQTLGTPAILKTRRLGYDGKGQVRITDAGNAAWALDEIGHAPAIVEGFVPFRCEVSVLVVRGSDGATAFYDVPLNTHRAGILDTSAVPSGLPRAVEARARDIAAGIAAALDYVGLLAVEMFYLGEKSSEPLAVNEIAPRVHNSGHWTIDACAVSQFENHIRAVAGWPLGPTLRHSDAVMTNLIGEDYYDWPALAAKPGPKVHCVHLYGKNEARAGRKMGHVTVLEPKSRA